MAGILSENVRHLKSKPLANLKQGVKMKKKFISPPSLEFKNKYLSKFNRHFSYYKKLNFKLIANR